MADAQGRQTAKTYLQKNEFKTKESLFRAYFPGTKRVLFGKEKTYSSLKQCLDANDSV